MKQYYDMILRRKSVRRYNAAQPLAEEELAELRSRLDTLRPLLPEIPVTFRIVKRTETNCLWGEYCVLAYSAVREGYLTNIGYMMEQVDLYLASRELGSCWYGMGKAEEKCHGEQQFVIMMAFGRCDPAQFRENGAGLHRKSTETLFGRIEDRRLWNVLAAARCAPSACNSQPWRVEVQGNRLKVFRAVGVRTPFTKGLIDRMNPLDMGIFLLFLELALAHEKISFQRELLPEDTTKERIPVAVYTLDELEQ